MEIGRLSRTYQNLYKRLTDLFDRHRNVDDFQLEGRDEVSDEAVIKNIKACHSAESAGRDLQQKLRRLRREDPNVYPLW